MVARRLSANRDIASFALETRMTVLNVLVRWQNLLLLLTLLLDLIVFDEIVKIGEVSGHVAARERVGGCYKFIEIFILHFFIKKGIIFHCELIIRTNVYLHKA